MRAVMKNDDGVIVVANKGWSWTTLCFGLFVPLLRGDLKWFSIMLAVGLIASILIGGSGFVLINIIFAPLYNKLFMNDLCRKGYSQIGDTDVFGN